MSGQPNRKPQDADNFRDDYMNQLNLRAAVDDVNYQANKTYKATGALPPQSSMSDNRSTSEILADVARLKVELIAEFKPILKPQSAALLIQRIEQSPLNGDGSLLVFLAQNAKQIVPKLQMRYAKGVKGDEGDIETLKAFIENLYTELKDSTGSIKSFFDRPQNQSMELQMNSGDYKALIRQYDKIRLQLMSKSDPVLNDLLKQISDVFDIMDDCYDMNQQTINEYTKALVLLKTPRPDQVRSAQELLEFVSDIPNPSQLRALIAQLDKSTKNSKTELSRTILTNILSILPTSPAKNLTLQRVPHEIRRYVTDPDEFIESMGGSQYDVSLGGVSFISTTPSSSSSSSAYTTASSSPSSSASTTSSIPSIDAQINGLPQPSTTPLPTDSQSLDGKLTGIAHAANGSLYNLLDAALNVRVDNAEDEPNATDLGLNSDAELRAIIRDTLGKYIHQQTSADSQYRLKMNLTIPIQTEIYNVIIETYRQIITTMNNVDILAFANQLRDDIDRRNQNLVTVFQRMGINGTGVKRGRGRPRVQGKGIATPKKFLVDKVDHSAGIKPDKKYIPFGKYYIHRHKLNDNILSFRHPSGVSVIGQPAHRVSDKLGNVMRDIVGGKVPSFNDLSGLTEDEKSYLYKVSKRAEIADKLSIPTPSKDAFEKDIHDFEVMKGEIMAGNDSVPLIKKFKLLLLRLSKSGTLPKADVQEIMEELLTLGY